MKISRTMKRKGIDNFREWRARMRQTRKIPAAYPSFLPSGDLAEYMGVVLGDGNISKFPRTERLIISGNSNNKGFIQRYTVFTKRLFRKKPTVSKVCSKNCARVSIYQKEISKRLGIPCGSRFRRAIRMPRWIWCNNKYLIRFLRGLFEAEGSLSIHIPTCTYNFQFSNTNKSLLRIVERGLKKLSYHPEVRPKGVRLRRKHEVESFRKLITFREYF